MPKGTVLWSAVLALACALLLGCSNPLADDSDTDDGTPEAGTARLLSLTVSSGTLTPEFSPETTDYHVIVGNDVTSITLSGGAMDPNATVSGNNGVPLPLDDGALAFQLTVTSGTESLTYRVIVFRAGPTNADLLSLEVDEGELRPPFSPQVTEYTVAVPSSVEMITVSGTPSDQNASICDTSAASQSLDMGENTILITVTAEDGLTTKAYKVVVTRLHDSSLSALMVDSGTLTPDFDPTVTSYTVTVGPGVTEIVISAVTADPEASVSGISAEPQALNTGANVFTITVTAPDTTTSTDYVVTVYRVQGNQTTFDLHPGLIGSWRRTDWEHATLVLTRDSFSYIRPLYDYIEHELTTFEGRAFLMCEDGDGFVFSLHLVTESITEVGNEREMPGFYEYLIQVGKLEPFLYHAEVSGTTTFTNHYSVVPGDGETPTTLAVASYDGGSYVSEYLFEKLPASFRLPSGSIDYWYTGGFEGPAQVTAQLMYDPAGADEEPMWEPASVTVDWEGYYHGPVVYTPDDPSLTYVDLVFGDFGWDISDPHARIQRIGTRHASDGWATGEVVRVGLHQTRITWFYVDRDVHIVGHTDHGDADLDLKTGWNQVVRTCNTETNTEIFRIGAEPDGTRWELIPTPH